MAMFNFGYDATNTALFSAVNVNAITRSKSELASEEQSDKAIGAVSGAENASNIQTFNGLQTTGKTVMFNDPTSGNRVQLQLTDENLKRLEEKFGSQDFYKREDGTIRLSGKAEAFVSGWFADVAYRQNYVGADADKDGVISRSEIGNVRSAIMGAASYANGTITLEGERGYASSQMVDYDYIESAGFTTLTDRLNYTLKNDENLDGMLSGLESLTPESKQYLLQQFQQLGAFQAGQSGTQNKDGLGGGPAAMLAALMEELQREGPKQEAALKKKEEEEKKLLEKIREKRKEAEEALEKLREKNGEVAKLGDSQKSLLSNSEIVKNHPTGKLDSNEIAKLAEELQKLAEREVLGNNTTKANNPLSELDKELISVVDNIRKETQSGAASAVDALDVRA